MKYFNLTKPKSTKFNTNMHGAKFSYRGIPKEYPSGEKIPRATRLRIAKEVAKIKKGEEMYDVYNNKGEFLASFHTEQSALEFKEIQDNPDEIMVHKRKKDNANMNQMETYINKENLSNSEHARELEERNARVSKDRQDEAEGREVLSQSLGF